MAVAGRGNMNVHETSDELRGQCDMCEVETSDGYCAECEMQFCNECFGQHLKIKKCRDHVLQDGPEGHSNATNIRYKPCIQHDNQAIKFHCTDHKVFGCAECIVVGHRDCKCEYISEVTKRFQDSGELDGMLTKIETLTRTKEEHKQAIESLENKNIAMEETAINEIESFVQSALDMIGAAKMSAIEETHSKIDRNKQSIAKHRHTLQMIDSQLADLNVNFSANKQPHEMFVLAVESEQILSSIRDTLDRFDSTSITQEFVFEPNKSLEKILSGQKSLGRFTDDETENEEDMEIKYNKACERIEELQESMKGLNAELEIKTVELDTIKQNSEKQISLPCGHTERIEQLTEQRTIRCSVCNIVSGDQPVGKMTTIVKLLSNTRRTYHEMTFVFPPGTESKMNRNPGRQYSGSTQTGYLMNDAESDSVFSMMKTAFDRNLLFTIDENGSIVNGEVEVCKYIPLYGWDEKYVSVLFVVYDRYIKRVKEQLAAVGITE